MEGVALHAEEFLWVVRAVVLSAARAVATVVGLLALVAEVVAELVHSVVEGLSTEGCAGLGDLVGLVEAEVAEPLEGLFLHSVLYGAYEAELVLEGGVRDGLLA